MRVIEKGIQATCEWCNKPADECDLVLYGEEQMKVMCVDCIESLHAFLVEIDVKEAEV